MVLPDVVQQVATSTFTSLSAAAVWTNECQPGSEWEVNRKGAAVVRLLSVIQVLVYFWFWHHEDKWEHVTGGTQSRVGSLQCRARAQVMLPAAVGHVRATPSSLLIHSVRLFYSHFFLRISFICCLRVWMILKRFENVLNETNLIYFLFI